MTPSIQVLDRVGRVSPLGVRFWDAVSNRFISDGLSVTAFPASNPERRTSAVRNFSDVFVFRNLPGTESLEFGSGETDYWAGLPQRLPFVVEMTDRDRRFLPVRFRADLPAQGLFTPVCVSPPQPDPGVPLFSTPNRAAPASLAAIRADLWDVFGQRPAAWALGEAAVANSPVRVRGMADEMGRLTMLLPWPEPVDAAIGSPAVPAGPPLEQQSWGFTLRIWYSQAPATDIPDLCWVLRQSPATLWMDAPMTRPLSAGTLRYARDTILQSSGLSKALITPAGSPP